MRPPPIPPEAYERLDALKRAAIAGRAAAAAGDTMALEDARVASGIHWRELVRLCEPELSCTAEPRSSGS